MKIIRHRKYFACAIFGQHCLCENFPNANFCQITVFTSFGLSTTDKKKYQTVKEKFDSYFVKRKNVIYECAVFNRRKQEDGEKVDSFITSLYKLVKHCEYGDLREKTIRD